MERVLHASRKWMQHIRYLSQKVENDRALTMNTGKPLTTITDTGAKAGMEATGDPKGGAPLKLDPDDDYRTQRKPSYILPFYGASDERIYGLSDAQAKEVLKVYGGLVRRSDTGDQWRERLRKVTRAWHLPKHLTIRGVVVSNKMNKSVVVAAKRAAFNSKLQMSYFKTRRFMAHDELNLCREGDDVVIRSCRPLSKHKAHVVVVNFGDKLSIEQDDREIVLVQVD